MKKAIALLSAFQLFFICLLAQNNLPPVDKSPMDMSYYPVNYPILKINDKITEPLAARVVYSRPQKAGRTIFGGLLKYGEVWRMGANEATEIEFFKNVRFGGKKINKGRYTLYAIVNETSWTIIINKETDTWGSFKYDAKKDVARKDITIQKTDTIIESLAMAFEKTLTGFNLVIAWDNVKASVPFTF
ncbi:MAG: DUF2911 domain-containing protein [Chitinophagaceae bacterium]